MCWISYASGVKTTGNKKYNTKPGYAYAIVEINSRMRREDENNMADFREIDDRYPEFAEPYEPVKGAKHYSSLKFGIKVKMKEAAAVLVTAALIAAGFSAPKGPDDPKKPFSLWPVKRAQG